VDLPASRWIAAKSSSIPSETVDVPDFEVASSFVLPGGNDRVSGTHLDRVSGAHLGL
jgi:hypothetical protein